MFTYWTSVDCGPLSDNGYASITYDAGTLKDDEATAVCPDGQYFKTEEKGSFISRCKDNGIWENVPDCEGTQTLIQMNWNS